MEGELIKRTIDLPSRNCSSLNVRNRIGILGKRQEVISKQTYTTEQIINKLREAEVLISQGKTIPKVAKALSISDQTYYRWCKEYGGLRTDQAQWLRELELETTG